MDGPFYVDYPIGPSNSGWRGNFAKLFSHQKIFVVTKLSCRIWDNSSISLIFTRYGIFNILFFDLTLNPAVESFGFRTLQYAGDNHMNPAVPVYRFGSRCSNRLHRQP